MLSFVTILIAFVVVVLTLVLAKLVTKKRS